ncbi:MAG: diguanylate cyclase [Pelomonas sp.]|nr:diguanylate cyclase [Roseateles sp.]
MEPLDLAPPGTCFISPPDPAAPDGGAKPRLLVIDDDAVTIQALYRAFAEDHQVLMATSGALGLELCATRAPDLVLLDVMMPDIDGFEVCRRLKDDAATRDTPVIFVTGSNDTAAEARGLEMGASDFIAKPINPPVVRARVRSQLIVKAHVDLLRHFAYVDGLTGVYNRRHLDQQLEVERSRAKRAGGVLTVLLVDVDHFKRYNDRYGHQAGDDTLRRVATALRTTLKRPSDLVARYGGEEFACVLPGTDRAGAEAVGEQLRAAVAALGIEHDASPSGTHVTISVGSCTELQGLAGSASALLQQADAQLYRAKAEGRNRVCATEL